jgi:elongation of very long chain fatty acids protein 7
MILMIAKKDINVAVYILQVQFILVVFHDSQLFFVDCDYPTLIAWVQCTYAVVFLYLFVDFYKQAYKKKQPSKVRSGILHY